MKVAKLYDQSAIGANALNAVKVYPQAAIEPQQPAVSVAKLFVQAAIEILEDMPAVLLDVVPPPERQLLIMADLETAVGSFSLVADVGALTQAALQPASNTRLATVGAAMPVVPVASGAAGASPASAPTSAGQTRLAISLDLDTSFGPFSLVADVNDATLTLQETTQ
jgi:hypothetical protein